MEYDELAELATDISAPDSGLEVKNRRYHLRMYQNCFIGL